MADEYKRRFGIPFDVFANCVDDEDFTKEHDERRPLSDPVELVYVGGLHLGRWRCLANIAEAIDTLGREKPEVRLTIYAPESDLERFSSTFAGYSSARLARWLHREEVPVVLRSADVLVHVESFDPDHRLYTRLSLSTKIPQYLAAGRPVLGYGPVEVASMRHIEQARAGVVVGADPEALREALRQLQRSDQRHHWGKNGVEYARENHRREVLATRFAGLLRHASRRHVTAGMNTTR
jgi:glycosyltransferase involved in cell wall biosynthesis